MERIQGIAGAVLMGGTGLALHAAHAQQPGLRRTGVLQHDLSLPGRSVVQVRVDFDPGAVSERHGHPGDEIAYVLEGTLEYAVDRKPPVTLHAGEALFIPAGVKHVARNVGTGGASELATYLVRSGRPVVVLATPRR